MSRGYGWAIVRRHISQHMTQPGIQSQCRWHGDFSRFLADNVGIVATCADMSPTFPTKLIAAAINFAATIADSVCMTITFCGCHNCCGYCCCCHTSLLPSLIAGTIASMMAIAAAIAVVIIHCCHHCFCLCHCFSCQCWHDCHLWHCQMSSVY